MPRGGRRPGSGRKKGGMKGTISDKDMRTFLRVVDKLAGGTDNHLLKVAALLIGIAPLVGIARSIGTDLPDLLRTISRRPRASFRTGITWAS
jgi:hypothetical protein